MTKPVFSPGIYPYRPREDPFKEIFSKNLEVAREWTDRDGKVFRIALDEKIGTYSLYVRESGVFKGEHKWVQQGHIPTPVAELLLETKNSEK